MDYSLIVTNSDSLFDRYKDLSLLELGLSLYDLIEHHENDLKNLQISVMIFRMQKQLFIKIYLFKFYCEDFRISNAVDAQNFLNIYILGQVYMQE